MLKVTLQFINIFIAFSIETALKRKIIPSGMVSGLSKVKIRYAARFGLLTRAFGFGPSFVVYGMRLGVATEH